MDKSSSKFSFSEKVIDEFLKKQYGIVGSHSAVQICGWTKRMLRGKGACYKQKFYGADCASCAQMSPAAAWCSQNCIFCWRPMEWMDFRQMEEEEVDSPREIIEGTVAAKRKLVSGLGGAEDVDEGLFRRVLDSFPAHWAISLSGEPTLYPRLPELIKELKGNPEVKTVFLVTNGQEPEMLLRLKEEGALPTQLYISVDAAEKETFEKVNVPVYSDGWERLNRALEMIADFPCRRVLRFTVIKGVNDLEGMLPLYGKMLEKSGADFIEVKAYMWLGYSRRRLGEENMPSHEYVRELCGKLLDFLPGYSFEDEDEKSRIVLLKSKKSKYDNIIGSVEG
ncbi:4-demethylwyosine synthase TYW1 [Candidatus Micrarchaeota archaeon]|nr:4-demethylwyosine synthase TYW1 [Candidatus Micrarchaeota archaeon]MBD3417848.1 4-demethylwyosine synthase TYW1 [Candidatus Micrarchaeota archaeon]